MNSTVTIGIRDWVCCTVTIGIVTGSSNRPLRSVPLFFVAVLRRSDRPPLFVVQIVPLFVVQIVLLVLLSLSFRSLLSSSFRSSSSLRRLDRPTQICSSSSDGFFFSSNVSQVPKSSL
ncbi:hypothetical protein SO802_024051 [Lithocarpus litseifolius]|uniref:Transmembrane protein n=1 Tax=Lithocarpus litseifolius TaxID=425828 RepID=A0AAW2C9G3_9ROSI